MSFIETSIHQQIVETVDYVVRARATATITSRPGVGKSTSLRHIANDEHYGALLIDYMPRFRTMKGLHKAFLEACGYPDHSRSSYDMEEIAEEHAKKLAEDGCCLLVDEFQNFDLDAIRGILRFSDRYRLPMVFVGNMTRMRRIKADAHTYEQISDRMWKKVTLLDPSQDDILLFARAFNVVGSDAMTMLVEIGFRTTIRHVSHVLETARLACGEAPITADRLREVEHFIAS